MNPIMWIRVAAGVALLAVCFYGGWLIHNHGANSVQVKWDHERAERGQALAEAQARVRDLENQLVTDVADIREATNEEITALSTQRDSLAARVRNAEARARLSSASAAAAAPALGPVDHKPELLGSFGVQDVDEAYRADLIRVELLACYAQYERAEAALNQAGDRK